MKNNWLLILLLFAFPFAILLFVRVVVVQEKPFVSPASPTVQVSQPQSPPEVSIPPTAVPVVSNAPAPTVPEPAVVGFRHSAPAEKAPATVASAPAVAPQTTDRPVVMLEGSYTKENSALVYEPEAKVLLSNDVVVFSPTGVMVSDEKQNLFVGDMQMETAKNTIVANEAVLDAQAGRMTAKSVEISIPDENNQLIRMTGENVTLHLPAKKEPSPPLQSTTAAATSPEAPQEK